MTAKHLTRTKAGKALLSLVVLALLAGALKSLVFSDASYVGVNSNPGSVFTAGSLSHTNSGADQVVLDAAYLRPGMSKEGTLTILGGGDLPGAYTVSKAGVTDMPASPGLSNTLVLQIQDLSQSSPAYNNTVALMPAAVTLGSIAPGVTRTFRFRLTYPAGSADSDLDGATMALRLTFTGVTP